MQADFDRIAAFQGAPDFRVRAWQRFIEVWATSNPTSNDDERLRDQAQQRLRAAEIESQRQRLVSAQPGTGTGGASSRGTAAFDAAPSDTYAGLLIAAVRPNIVFTERLAGNPAAEVEVTAEPDGRITGRRLSKSSGRRDWDEAVLRAIDRMRELPKDIDGRVPPKVVITFRPND
jgi:colicin import membrane protein